ncbi:hypothetical protein C7293_25040 [filamentous cyanobacterium CCT1]|nr:hypothetical protein C7293_25040 [filamentous cyanobacterium CCT1]PSN80918.1 hypothetical protein C8B47_04160 [filamentous cyanobacterium CCP4]
MFIENMEANSINACPFIINAFVFIEFAKAILIDREVNSIIAVTNSMITVMNSMIAVMNSMIAFVLAEFATVILTNHRANSSIVVMKAMDRCLF